MSQIDDLMVDVMMRSDDEAEIAVVQLIRLFEAERLDEKQQQLVMKAVQRRIKKVKFDTDIYDLLERLANLIATAENDG